MLAVTVAFATLFVSGHIGRKPHERPDAAARTAKVATTVSGTVPGTYRGITAAGWARRFRERSTQLRHARRVLFSRPSVAEAIELAAATYRVSSATLWRKARCESNLNPRAQNASEASGLFQFLPSTWKSTPFGRFSIFSPYSSALAAGWMHSVGRGGEWVCR